MADAHHAVGHLRYRRGEAFAHSRSRVWLLSPVADRLPATQVHDMNEPVHSFRLSDEDEHFLRKLHADMPIVCDVSRADFLLYRPLDSDRAIVSVHMRPRSIAPTRLESAENDVVSADDEPLVFRAMKRGRAGHGSSVIRATGAPIVQQVYPIFGPGNRVIAALSIETNLLEHERHRRRRPAFQRALRQMQAMFLRGELVGANLMEPFGEHDGILVADRDMKVLYVSGIATNLYRRLGYGGTLVGRHLTFLKTGDANLVEVALAEMRCVEAERQEGHRHWSRKVIPLLPQSRWLDRVLRFRRRDGTTPNSVIVLIHDATAARRREQALRVRSAMIQEVHHRVKNNLQAVASLLRIQARRARTDETRAALNDGVNRILSVAVVHEFLSQHESKVINIREVSQRIIAQVQQNTVPPDKTIRFTLRGRSIYLPNQEATACALVINELLNNALEHGFEHQSEGMISVELEDSGDQVVIRVADDGEGLPRGFESAEETSLGLTIVRTLVQNDLKGSLHLERRPEGGTAAEVRFPKTTLGGDGSWTEQD
jgi:two-component sensor histidine kinase